MNFSSGRRGWRNSIAADHRTKLFPVGVGHHPSGTVCHQSIDAARRLRDNLQMFVEFERIKEHQGFDVVLCEIPHEEKLAVFHFFPESVFLISDDQSIDDDHYHQDK